MNHRAKFDAASFILGGEIRIRTNAHTQKKQTITAIEGDWRLSTHADPILCTLPMLVVVNVHKSTSVWVNE